MGRWTTLHATFVWGLCNDEQLSGLAMYGLETREEFVAFVLSTLSDKEPSDDELVIAKILKPMFIRFPVGPYENL